MVLRRRAREYRRGERPSWAPEAFTEEAAVEEEEEEEVEHDDVVDIHEAVQRAPRVRPTTSKIRIEAIVESEAAVPPPHVRPAVVAAVETAGLEVPEVAAASESDEEDVDVRRQRARMKRAVEPALSETVAPAAVEEEVSEEEEEETETEEEEEEDFQEYGRPLIKPVFVARSNRKTTEERAAQDQLEREREERDQAQIAERKREATAKLIDVIEREELEQEMAVKASLAERPDDTDYPDDEVEIEKWKLREMVRLLRDREERRLAEEEMQDTARRRTMSDAEIEAEKAAARANAPEKGKLKFLQRYHHKGAFYQDKVDTELLQRDYAAPTGVDAEIDRAALPAVLQVKNFGFASRTKYTHLADQDTSRDDPWAASDVSRPTGYKRGRDSQSSANGDKRYRQR
ncbi:unnamed protein product (mitochondrion) [Plasmodiophora brassicae]|uniref:Micro-fibrillar-associated protein 1 C-terminal domain-containing protein n=2 Tax=Plasmodiophora brassicae TaxID=37360 RepID=A0A3P3Y099_PLABS|nr:unnamed protein product [Plasmodiophora brassicae]